MDGGDAVLVGELAHKTKPADTASETSSLPEQKGFRGFVLLDTQDFTGEPKNLKDLKRWDVFIAGSVLRASSYKLFNQYKTFILKNKAVRGRSSFEILE